MIKSSKEILPHILSLIQSTFLGSRGAKYKLLNSAERSKNLDHPIFYFFEKNNHVLGTITFCNRPLHEVSENYIRYFAFDPSFQSTKEHKSSPRTKGNSIRNQFNILLNSDVFQKHEEYCYYAFVDDQNFKSMNMAETFGFEKMGQFKTTSFSRVAPKKRIEVLELKGNQKLTYLKELTKQYQAYNFFHPVNIEKGKTYGYFEGEHLLIAATFYPTKWEIKSMPGKNGELKINLLSKAPIINKFFKNKKFSFLGMEGLICHKEQLYNQFLESVLSETNQKVILYWSDLECTISNQIDAHLKKGILSRFSKQENANIIIKHNLKVNRYQNKPTYISPYDIS